MRADSAVFSAYNTAASKRPRIVVRVSFDTANTDLLYLTSHDDADLPDGAVSSGIAIQNVVRAISGQTQQINPDQANSTIGGFSFSVVDVGSALTVYLRDKLTAGDGLRRKQVKVYIGYQGMLWADYITALTYIIDSVTYANGEYKFKCSDLQREVRKQIFEPQVTYLTKTVTASQMHIPCLETNLTKFPVVAHDASYTDHPSASVQYIKLEEEIICHSGLFTHGTDGVSYQVVERGALNSKATEHVLDAAASSERKIKIEEHIYLEGPAPKVTYALLTGELYGQSATLPSHWHLGISTSYVQTSDFTDIGADFWNTTTNTGRHVRFEGLKKQDGKKFIETELLIWLGAYMPVYSSGKLGLKRLAPVLSNSGYVVALNLNNIASYSDLEHDFGAVINQISVEWNYVFLKDDYTKTTALPDSDSYAKHGAGNKKNLKLKGVHTGRHADSDIASYFDTLRDRYAGPPLRMSVTVLPSLNWLEVGDTVRVTLDTVRDFTNGSGTTLDRVFEIQKVDYDWLTGDVKLELFGSSMKAGTLTKTTAASVLADSLYSSEGTELSTVLTISAGAVTANGSLTGGSTMAAGIYYYLGDLTINAGVTVQISDNVQLRVMGHLTINGTIDGKGRGLAGGAGATLWSNGLTVINSPGVYPEWNAGLGTVGVGITVPGRPHDGKGHYTANPIKTGMPSVPYYAIKNNSTTLDGLPIDLRGTSGTGGAAQRLNQNATTYTIYVPGTAGGNSGAGLNIISRGLSFGANGRIDLSGNDAPENNNTPWVYNGTSYFGMSGAGGAPGACAIFLDGNHTPPELVTELIQLHGDSPYKGDRNNTGILGYVDQKNYGLPGILGFDMADAAYTLQYIPAYNTAGQENDPPPPDVTGFTVSQNGGVVFFKWNPVRDDNLDGYEIRYSASTVNNWDDALPLTVAAKGTRITDGAISSGDYRFYIRAYDLNDQYSQNAATQTLTVVSDFDIIVSSEQSPDWLGTLTNFVKHWTGVLIPQSQDTNSLADDIMDIAVPRPYALCSYEGTVLDVSFDDTIRAWSEVTASMLPSEAGTLTINKYVDYRTSAGAYDGFEAWESGDVYGRYVKFKLEMDTTTGVGYVSGHRCVADLIERSESATAVAIGATGTTINFASAFHVAPYVEATNADGTAKIVSLSNITTTSFDVDVYNTSGTGVTGTINWSARGV